MEAPLEGHRCRCRHSQILYRHLGYRSSFSAVVADYNRESGVDVLTGVGKPRFPGKTTLPVSKARSECSCSDRSTRQQRGREPAAGYAFEVRGNHHPRMPSCRRVEALCRNRLGCVGCGRWWYLANVCTSEVWRHRVENGVDLASAATKRVGSDLFPSGVAGDVTQNRQLARGHGWDAAMR